MKSIVKTMSVIILAGVSSYFFTAFKKVNFDYSMRDITEVQLGELLFKDPILSGNGRVSCASCHKPEFAFADNSTFSLGVNNFLTSRNTPTAMYNVNKSAYFWDGRASSLEQQAAGPITNKKEMNGSIPTIIQKLRKDPKYDSAFRYVYGRRPDSVLLLRAISSFERSLVIYDSPYDRFLKGDDSAMNESAIRGFKLFFRKNSCGNTACHAGNDFSSDSLVNIGIFSPEDRGLFELTGKTEDIGRFKSPTLRNIALTAPYMHDGSHKTLREVMDYYNDMKNFPLNGNSHPDVKEQGLRPMPAQSIDDLIEFMKALTDYKYIKKGTVSF